MSTLTQDPISGIWSSNADPTGTGRTMTELNGGLAPAASTGSGQPDPYTVFNKELASILTQIQTASSAGAASLGKSADALTTEGVGAAGAYDPTATPAVNLQNQTGTLGAFAPAITDVNTQLSNANASIGNLGTEISGLETAYKPTTVGPGDSTVTPGGNVVTTGTDYSPQINPMTGELESIPTNSITGAGGSGGGTGGGSGAGSGGSSTGGGAGGLDAILGASNPIGAYAEDPNYVPEITGLVSTIQGLGVTSSADTLQQYITNNAKGAPVTGQMILNAANTYGIDPNLLTGILLHESDFGTAGAATTTMNPGNVGNTGSNTMAFKSWQAGVMATANNLAERISKAPSGSATSASGPTQSAVGGTFNATSSAQVAKLPSTMQAYVQSGVFGTAYVDLSRVPQNLQQAVTNVAGNNGIPVLQAADVATAQALDAVQQNMTLMKTTAQSTLGSGFMGGLGDILATNVNHMTFGNAFPNFGKFNEYATAAVGILKGLAGSGGGFRITQSEINTAQENIPTSTDTIKNAEQKMQVLQGLINTTVSKIFPDAPIPILLPDGTKATVPAKNYSAAYAAGAIPQ